MRRSIIEVAVGTINGSNREFRTPGDYIPGSLVVFLNGLALKQAADYGWSELGRNKFRLNNAPLEDDVVQVFYHPV